MLATLLASALCVIIVPSKGPHPDWFRWKPIYWHEIAHCNGFEHPETDAKEVGEGYTSFEPPARYLHKPSMPVDVRAVTIKQAQKLCGGHWGCQWFE